MILAVSGLSPPPKGHFTGDLQSEAATSVQTFSPPPRLNTEFEVGVSETEYPLASWSSSVTLTELKEKLL